jgi:hypothetical protein
MLDAPLPNFANGRSPAREVRGNGARAPTLSSAYEEELAMASSEEMARRAAKTANANLRQRASEGASDIIEADKRWDERKYSEATGKAAHVVTEAVGKVEREVGEFTGAFGLQVSRVAQKNKRDDQKARDQAEKTVEDTAQLPPHDVADMLGEDEQ